MHNRKLHKQVPPYGKRNITKSGATTDEKCQRAFSTRLQPIAGRENIFLCLGEEKIELEWFSFPSDRAPEPPDIDTSLMDVVTSLPVFPTYFRRLTHAHARQLIHPGVLEGARVLSTLPSLDNHSSLSPDCVRLICYWFSKFSCFPCGSSLVCGFLVFLGCFDKLFIVCFKNKYVKLFQNIFLLMLMANQGIWYLIYNLPTHPASISCYNWHYITLWYTVTNITVKRNNTVKKPKNYVYNFHAIINVLESVNLFTFKEVQRICVIKSRYNFENIQRQ